MNKSALRLFSWVALAAALVFVAAPASAQYKPRTTSDPATGEKYHIEVGGDFWMPTAEMTVSSESLGIQGSQIDFRRDLGLTDQRFRALQVQLRPARSHKLRLQYIPVAYMQSATLSQRIVFNGIAYNVGVPVNSTLDWKTYQFGYEYDFVVKNSGFAGLILEAKYTDVQVSLVSPFASEFAHARAPIPAIGGIARYYVVPNIAITGEFTGFYWPDKAVASISGQAHYYDIDVYGTLNFTNNIGVKGGYRSRDVGYLINSDSGAFVMKGIYFGAVLRY
jgi:hypothetical protein